MATNVTYSQDWIPIEFVCGCKVKCRVDVEPLGTAFAAPFFQHGCGKDAGRDLPGKVRATWEERDGKWVLTGSRP